MTFFKEAVSGSVGKKATIKFVRTEAGKVREYMDHALENCLVSHYAMVASVYAKPAEVILLSSYWPYCNDRKK